MRFASSGRRPLRLHPERDMLRVRAIVTIIILIAVIYAFAPAERKRRWLDKVRELGKALAVSIVIYWIYMLVLFFLRQG